MADYVLDPGEKIIERVNRYWADLIGVVVASAAITIMALFGVYVYARFRDQFPFLTPGLVTLIVMIMLTVVALMLFSAVYVYQYNYLLVTNFHLIKVQQVGLFARQTAELGLGNIEDVRGGRSGVLATILDYGDIEIQSAGASEQFIIRTMHHPQVLADRLLEYKRAFKAHHSDIPGM
jgi:hypothetical protein